MYKFLEKHKRNINGIENLNSPVYTKMVYFVTKILPQRKFQVQLSLLVNSIKHVRRNNTNLTQTLSENRKEMNGF